MTHHDQSSDAPGQGWDIHCHTVFSDGTCTPRELVCQAKRLGLHGVAITDHDTTAGWEQAAEAARELGMPLLRGTEITADADGISVHLLALQYRPDEPHMMALFAATREQRLVRARRMVEAIARDYPIDWQLVLAQVKEGEHTTVGRPHIADALVAAGVYPDRSSAFRGIVSSTSPYYLPTPSPEVHDVVCAVREAGGVSVIAHAADPSRNRRILDDATIAALADDGLDGLEVWHRGNPPRQRKRLLALAGRHGLLVTGGSDWHGAGKPNELGEYVTDDDTVACIIERGAITAVQPDGTLGL